MYNKKMRFSKGLLGALALFIMFCAALPEAYAFGEFSGACGGDCMQCHNLKTEDASNMLKGLAPGVAVKEVRLSVVGGLWEVVFELDGKPGLVYVDFAGKHVIQGSIIDMSEKSDITKKRLFEISFDPDKLPKVDLARIPLGDALVMGKKTAKHKFIVFDDPD